MLRNSDSEESDSGSVRSDHSNPTPSQWTGQPVLRQPRLVMQEDQALEEMAKMLEVQRAQRQVLEAQLAQHELAAQQHQATVAQGRQVQVDGAGTLEWTKLQAATSLDLRKDVASIDRFNGDIGELNHFLRSGDGVSHRIAERLKTGRLDELDAQSLQTALVRRVQRQILNRLQADETTPWAEIKRRLQKEYGGGRWTPEEDALRLLRMVRGPRQPKGDFAAQLLRRYNSVVDKYRETLPGPEATARVELLEALVKVQLAEATGGPVTGTVVEEANRILDAAGREGERDEPPKRQAEWHMARRPAEDRWQERRRDHREKSSYLRRSEDRPRRQERGPVKRTQPKEGPRCYTCGKRGHIQARCPEVKCFECNTPGHLARSCPYMRPQRRGRDEPMEVNANIPDRDRLPTKRTERMPEERARAESSSSEDRSGDGETTDGDERPRSYVMAVRRGRPSRQMGTCSEGVKA